MQNDIGRVLLSEAEIVAKVKELGDKLTEEYRGKELLVVGILKGSNVFMSDLIRQINIPLKIDFMMVSSYGNATESTGVVKIIKDIEQSISGKHLLIVEDIIDSGLTLKYLTEMLETRKTSKT